MKHLTTWLAGIFAVAMIAYCLRPAPKVGADGINYNRLGQLPVQSSGRVKPMSTEAMTSLKTLSGKSTVRKQKCPDCNAVIQKSAKVCEHCDESLAGRKGRTVKEPAITWYSRVLFDNEAAAEDPVFRVDNPDVKDHLGLDPDEKMYSFSQLEPNLQKIVDAAEPARERDAKKRSSFEAEMVNLHQKVVLYTALARSFQVQDDLGFAECAIGAQRLMPMLESMDPDPEKWTDEERQAASMTRSLFGLIGQMAQMCPLRFMPPPSAERLSEGMDPKEWRNPYLALFMGIRDQEPEQDLVFAEALANMQSNWPKAQDLDGGDEAATTFNRAVEDWHGAVAALKPQLAEAEVLHWLSWFTPFLQWSFASIAAVFFALFYLGRDKRSLYAGCASVALIVLGPIIAQAVDAAVIGDRAQIIGYAIFENWHNRLDPFYQANVLYVSAFILVCLGFLSDNSRKIVTCSVVLMVAAFLFHTVGMFDRMIVGGRPPVTTLHSSALFIGWFCVGVGFVLERFFKGGIGVIVGTTIAALTLMKGFQLAADGSDTMGALVAVLDSNFWLATHVICITIGYAACYVAAIAGHVYLFRGIFTNSLTRAEAKKLDTMAYGIMCFALFFSVVGTILGGIWADQSWGRFWGWDPKENGAMMICLWLIITLHARMGGYMKVHGTMLATVVASIVTTVSWFGVNLMGTGLHSYGFTQRGLITFLAFILFECGILLIGAIPRRIWRSAKVLLPQQAKT